MTPGATVRTGQPADGRLPGPDPLHVVVVAYGAAGPLDTCLGTLGGAFPVVVVDNSSDPDVQAVSERHRVRYLDAGGNLGFGAAVNVGLGQLAPLDGDVLLLNPDAAIAADGVLALRRHLDADPRLACVAPVQFDRDGGTPARVAWPFPTPMGAWMEAVGLGCLRRRAGFLIGSVLLVRGAALADVGGFDEQFFLYAEETDWQRRARDRGWDVAVCSDVVAVHEGAGTGGDPTVRETHFHASHERYLRKHYGVAGWQVYRFGVLAGSLLRSLVLRGPRGRRAALRFHLYRMGPCRMEHLI